MNTIFSILRNSARPKNGYFDGLEIRSKSGKTYSGTLVKWNPDTSPQVVCLVCDNGLAHISIDTIESVSVVNPA